MKFLNERERYSSELLLAATIALVSFLISMVGPISSSAQTSPLMSALNEISSSAVSSERLGPPLFTSGVSGEGTSPGPEQQQQPQQQYSLYENPQHGIRFEYPSDWQVREGGAGVVATISSPFEGNFDTFAANFVMGVENLTAGTSLDNYTKTVVTGLQSQPPGANFNFTGSPSSTTLGGLPALKIGFTVTTPNERSLQSETNVQGVQVLTIDNNTAYVLSFAAEQANFSSYIPIMEHAIDTFRIARTTGV
jgi:hypothetical protein